MSEFPRTQRIAALVVITVVVIGTLAGVSVTRPEPDSAAGIGPTVDALATPTAVPVLARPRTSWPEIRDTIRGAAGTRAPAECSIVDERSREANNFLSITPGLTFVCDQTGLKAHPIAPGRVVMRVDQPPLNSEKARLVANGKDGPWVRAAAYGPFIVVDHGPLNGVRNVTTVYAGLDSIAATLAVGDQVDPTTELGRLGARMINGELVAGVLTFELVSDDTRFGGDPLRTSPPPASAAATQATMLTDLLTLPVEGCSMPFGNPELLVGALREYRSGIHNGLDFNCGTTDHVITPAGAGEVLFVVDDFVDPLPEDRDAILANAAQAVDTPFWTLAMLYGRFVVVAHHLPNSDDQIVSIYAHMSEIDPNIVTGRQVDAATVLGRAGNTGTSTAAIGITDAHTSVHLHWEIHVNDRPVGYLADPAETEPLYRQMLCPCPEN